MERGNVGQRGKWEVKLGVKGKKWRSGGVEREWRGGKGLKG